MPEDGFHDGCDEAPTVGDQDDPHELAQVVDLLLFHNLFRRRYLHINGD